MSIRNIEDKNIISPLYERRIFFIPIDKIAIFREDVSKNGSAGIDSTPGRS
jgi:hypothetical protein